ncbi:MAG TPA: hypothetical protein PLF31_02895 [Candidatus Paceibacterota bacterium]|nr:hypothetical protein [Candidatus Paceibacterota bacterium]
MNHSAVVSQAVALPVFDTHVLKRVLKLESEVNDPVPLTDVQVDSDIEEYLGFLRQHKMEPGKDILPPVRVDRVWHIHMIQTEQYAQVCQEYLGRFLHHASMICGAGQERVYPWHYRGEREEEPVEQVAA